MLSISEYGSLVITDISTTNDIKNRLASMGLYKGAIISKLNYGSSTIVVKVGSSTIALGRELASKISII